MKRNTMKGEKSAYTERKKPICMRERERERAIESESRNVERVVLLFGSHHLPPSEHQPVACVLSPSPFAGSCACRAAASPAKTAHGNKPRHPPLA